MKKNKQTSGTTDLRQILNAFDVQCDTKCKRINSRLERSNKVLRN